MDEKLVKGKELAKLEAKFAAGYLEGEKNAAAKTVPGHCHVNRPAKHGCAHSRAGPASAERRWIASMT